MSDVGVGDVLLQNGKPVSYASRVWNDYEKSYAPIEKEMRDLYLDYTSSVTITTEDM